jgi:hypothetical protein
MRTNRFERAAMNLLSEDISDIPKGLIGVGLLIEPVKLDCVASKSFLELIKPFKMNCGSEKAFDFTMISEKPAPIGLVCLVHGHFLRNGKVGKTRFTLGRKPKAAVPNLIKKESKTIGGYPAGFSKFCEALNRPKLSCDAKLIGFILDRKLWPLTFRGDFKESGSSPLELENQTFT